MRLPFLWPYTKCQKYPYTVGVSEGGFAMEELSGRSQLTGRRRITREQALKFATGPLGPLPGRFMTWLCH